MKAYTRLGTARLYSEDRLGTKRNKTQSLPFQRLQTAITKPKCIGQKKQGYSNRGSKERDYLVKDIRKASLDKIILQVGNQG